MERRLVQTPHDDLTYRIIGCAMSVHRRLGPGHREDTYQRALEASLTAAGLAFESQKMLEVFDADANGALVGYYIPDLIVGDRVIVELKALDGLSNSHLAQAIGYLAVTGCPVALLINFGCRSLEWRRILPPADIARHRANRQWLFVPDFLIPNEKAA
jgi:GxxExxY protein